MNTSSVWAGRKPGKASRKLTPAWDRAVVPEKEYHFLCGDLSLAQGSVLPVPPNQSPGVPSRHLYSVSNILKILWNIRLNRQGVCRGSLLALATVWLLLMAPPFSCDPGWESGSLSGFFFFLPPLYPCQHKLWHLRLWNISWTYPFLSLFLPLSFLSLIQTLIIAYPECCKI